MVADMSPSDLVNFMDKLPERIHGWANISKTKGEFLSNLHVVQLPEGKDPKNVGITLATHTIDIGNLTRGLLGVQESKKSVTVGMRVKKHVSSDICTVHAISSQVHGLRLVEIHENGQIRTDLLPHGVDNKLHNPDMAFEFSDRAIQASDQYGYKNSPLQYFLRRDGDHDELQLVSRSAFVRFINL